ncbi:MAG TPA: VWA domain-containing protein [Terracidiphilus sp.]|jgi:VWFA-related protein|nr:VWA domain-containing protein [Terracidiphilus sp.]
MKRLSWLVMAVICLAYSSLAQAPSSLAGKPGRSNAHVPSQFPTLIPRTREDREAAYRSLHHIILNVLVTDASGKAVKGLKQEDFTLLDNQKPQAIASFRAVLGGAPGVATHVILMLDAINNSGREINYERKGVEKFLRQSQGRLTYPTSIAILSGSGASVSLASQNGETLLGDLQRLLSRVHGFNCADEGLGRDAEFAVSVDGAAVLPSPGEGLEKAHEMDCLNQRFQISVSALNRLATEQLDVTGRAILIWIGPGWPRLSDHGFRPDTAPLRLNFFDNLVQLSTTLREAQVTLDAVSQPDLFRKAQLQSDHDNALFDGVPTQDQVTAGSLSLQALAHQSGGRIEEENKDIASEIGACIADAESYYVLSYDSAPATVLDEYNSLKVKVNEAALTVRTNTVYYGLP